TPHDLSRARKRIRAMHPPRWPSHPPRRIRGSRLDRSARARMSIRPRPIKRVPSHARPSMLDMAQPFRATEKNMTAIAEECLRLAAKIERQKGAALCEVRDQLAAIQDWIDASP